MPNKPKPGVAQLPDDVDQEGSALWRPEWLIALVPLVAWLFAYYYERGMFIEAGVPNALFDVTFTRMMAVSSEAAFPIGALCFGASNVVQRIHRKSHLRLVVMLAITFGGGYGALKLTGDGYDALWRPLVIVGSVAVGFCVRVLSMPGTLVARYWASGYLRAYFIVVFCVLGGVLAQQLGKTARCDQTVFAVLELPCGPLIEVFRTHGDSVILVPLEFGPSRTGLASLNALGEINIRFAKRDEVRHRINFVGPCKPSKAEQLGLIIKS